MHSITSMINHLVDDLYYNFDGLLIALLICQEIVLKSQGCFRIIASDMQIFSFAFQFQLIKT